jgi:hypothetical protein
MSRVKASKFLIFVLFKMEQPLKLDPKPKTVTDRLCL